MKIYRTKIRQDLSHLGGLLILSFIYILCYFWGRTHHPRHSATGLQLSGADLKIFILLLLGS